MITIALCFIGNVLLDIAIWRSRTLPKWAGVIWLVWAVMLYVAGILYGFLFPGSSPPTQSIGSLVMAINGGWIVWTTFRQPPPILQRQQLLGVGVTPIRDLAFLLQIHHYYCIIFQPRESADLAAAMLRASSGDTADPL